MIRRRSNDYEACYWTISAEKYKYVEEDGQINLWISSTNDKGSFYVYEGDRHNATLLVEKN